MSKSADPTNNSAPSPLSCSRTPRYYTGVSLEPEVTRYLDDLSRRMRMNRSWVLNTIVHEYARFIEQKNITPLASTQEIIRL
ncbi:MAG TPA: CopG family transcriptional regulator [Tepidisphaeraceae bacterium]|jgi:hypothetical protein|nr:CopG family transcriptional regulator [Tepidisphaeraceae bacterium]